MWPTPTPSFQNMPVLMTAHFLSGALDRGSHHCSTDGGLSSTNPETQN
ncbi:hypothetical protein SynROS8604_01827 [Synechococcus sp. ROS8604]|nr:hypothetical protein SynROS8604_01827 [Synechococcus sp. ROS8604]